MESVLSIIFICSTDPFRFRWCSVYIRTISHQFGSIHYETFPLLSHFSVTVCSSSPVLFCQWFYICHREAFFVNSHYHHAVYVVFKMDPNVVLTYWHIIPPEYHHYAELLDGVDHINSLTGIFCRACVWDEAWWRHQMETFSASLALCAGNSPVTGECPSQRTVTRSFDVFFYLRLTNGWVNNREDGDLGRHHAHYYVTVMIFYRKIWHHGMKRRSVSLVNLWIPSQRATNAGRSCIYFVVSLNEMLNKQ